LIRQYTYIDVVIDDALGCYQNFHGHPLLSENEHRTDLLPGHDLFRRPYSDVSVINLQAPEQPLLNPNPANLLFFINLSCYARQSPKLIEGDGKHGRFPSEASFLTIANFQSFGVAHGTRVNGI
jgi:hypothetical protein